LVLNEAERLREHLRFLEAKSKDDCLNDLWEFLKLGDLAYQKKKMKGYMLPFHIREKNMRIPEDDPAHRYKVRNKKIPFSEVRK